MGVSESLGRILSDRPAEWATAATGGIGLLLSTVVAKNDEEVRTALVVILAALPATISYLYDLGRFGPRGRPLVHDLNQELDELALRALRRARLGNEEWRKDQEVLEKLIDIRNKLGPNPGSPAKPPSGSSSPAEKKSGATS